MTDTLELQMKQLGQAAKAASAKLALADRAQKDQALMQSAKAIRAATSSILDANANDMAAGVNRFGACDRVSGDGGDFSVFHADIQNCVRIAFRIHNPTA